MNIEEFSTLKGVPVFKAGNHDNTLYSDLDLDEMVSSFNDNKQYLRKSFDAGAYPENEHIILNKPIPAFLNLNHQRALPQAFKDLCKAATLSLSTQVIDGVKWIVADVGNLTGEVADFIKNHFPFRSVEIIPRLKNPTTQTWYKNVIRSIGFLDPKTPPAVVGQNPALTIENQGTNEGILCFYVHDKTEQPETLAESTEHIESIKPMEIESMSKDTKTQTPPVADTQKIEEHAQTPLKVAPETPSTAPPVAQPEVSVGMFDALQEKIKLLEQANSESIKVRQADQSCIKELQSKLAEAQAEREAAELVQYCHVLSHELHLAPVAVDIISPVLSALDNTAPLEFSETTMTSLKAVKNMLNAIIGHAKNGTLFVPIEELAADASKVIDPNDKRPQTINDVIQVLAEKHSLDAKEDYSKLWDMAAADPQYVELFSYTGGDE